jgi:hypothetical protein
MDEKPHSLAGGSCVALGWRTSQLSCRNREHLHIITVDLNTASNSVSVLDHPHCTFCSDWSGLRTWLIHMSQSAFQSPPLQRRKLFINSARFMISYLDVSPLCSCGQNSWLRIHRSRVRFPALPDFLTSSGSGMGSTQPRKDKWAATSMKSGVSGL